MSEEMTLRLEEFNGKEYILADNAIHCIGEHRRINSELHEEIERLNNIINELEQWLEEAIETISHISIDGASGLDMALKKIKELKESDKE